MTRLVAQGLLTLFALLPLVSGQAAPETALARRFGDSVAVRTGAERTERVLYYFDPTADLAQGDELEQGSSGHSEILLPGGARFELRATAHAILRRIAPDGDVVALPLVTRGYVEASGRLLTVVIPGGSRCVMRNTSLELRLDPGRIVVRNEGHEPIEVIGVISLERGETPSTHLSGSGSVVLERGHELHLPLLGLEPVGRGVVVETFGRLTVRHDGGYRVEDGDDGLLIERSSDDAQPEVLTIGGVRTWCEPGSSLVVASRRRVVPTTLTRMPSSADDPQAAAAPVNTLSVDKIVKALGQGITIEQIRAQGYEITPAQEAKAVKLLERASAAPQEEKDESP